MNRLKHMGLWPSGRFFRRHGAGIMAWSVALAAFSDAWPYPFIGGLFLLGLGIGGWEMEGGDL